jgi:hypothetical protein
MVAGGQLSWSAATSNNAFADSPTPVATFTGYTADTNFAVGMGYRVALSADGQTALVSPLSGGNQVFLYTESNGTWPTTPTAILTAPAGNEHPGGTLSVAVSGNGQTVLIGERSGNVQTGQGAAYLYTESNGTWPTTPTATFTGTGDPSVRGIGLSVALSADGQTALVGAPGFFDVGLDGAAYLYTESNGNWPATPTTAYNGIPGARDKFGASVSLSADGQTALIGAPDTLGSVVGSYDGTANLYTESNGNWPATPTATFSGAPGSFDELGSSVSLSADGKTALLGGPYAGSISTGSSDGAAFVYTESGNNWPTTPTASFTAAANSNGQLGFSVAISGSGQVALVGAAYAGGGQPYGSFQPGAAFVFRNSGGAWSTNPAEAFTQPTGQLGYSVALSGDGGVALLGALQGGGLLGGLNEYPGVAAIYDISNTPTATTTAVSSSANPSTVGQQVTYTATVSPAPDSGTVTFTDGGTAIPGCSSVPVSSGTANCATTYGATGSHIIAASYAGDTNFDPSISPSLGQAVAKCGPVLSGCNLSGANLINADLVGDNLNGANLKGSTLTGANLTGTDLSAANLKGANLSSTNLDQANLTNANLSGANLSGANLAGVALNGANIKYVIWSNTVCPDGTNSDNDGATCAGHL